MMEEVFGCAGLPRPKTFPPGSVPPQGFLESVPPDQAAFNCCSTFISSFLSMGARVFM